MEKGALRRLYLGFLIVAIFGFFFIFSGNASAQVAAYSIDGILVYEDANFNVKYLFRGHTPDIPNNTVGNPGPITAWDWFSGNPQTPSLGTPEIIGQGGVQNAPFPAMPKVAFSREGYAVVVYTRFTSTGQIDCSSDPENPNLVNKWRGDLRWALYQDGTPGVVDSGVIALGVENEYHVAPSVAIDNNGHGLAVWYHVIKDNPCTSDLTYAIHYSEWNGTSQTWTGDAHIGGADHVSPVPSNPSTAISFNSVVIDPVALPRTRQQAVAVWYDFIDIQTFTCPAAEITQNTFWPRYAVWDGDSWTASNLIPTPPNQWKSHALRQGKLDISSDQKGNSVPVWPILKVNDICNSDFEEEVWYARHHGTSTTPTGAWEKQAERYDDGTSASIAFEPGNELTANPDSQAATSFYAGTFAEGNPIKKARYETHDVWTQLGSISVGGSPTNAYLPHFRRLAAYTEFPSGIVRWYEEDRVTSASTEGGIEPGRDPDLAARGGSPTMPHARHTVMHYATESDNLDLLIHIDLIMNRIEQVGSSNIVTSIFTRDRGDSSTRSYYMKTAISPHVRDWGANLDFGLATTLRDVIAWSKEMYPADNYMITLENHGLGWRGVCFDDVTNNPLAMNRLRTGIREGLQDAVDDPTLPQPHVFSHVVFQACMMSMAEVAHQINDLGDFMIASGERMPAEGNVGDPGIPYETTLKTLVDNPFIDDQVFANQIVTDYQGVNGGGDYLSDTLASIRLSAISALVQDINTFAQEISNYVRPTSTVIAARRTEIRNHISTTIRMEREANYRDLFNFATKIANDAALPISMRNAAQNVLNHQANVISNVWADVNHAGWTGLNIWIQTSKFALQNASGTNTALSNAYLNTNFAAAAPNWHPMLVNIGLTPGYIFSLASDQGKLFTRVTDPSGNQVGYLAASNNELCSAFCGSDIPDASCSQNVEGVSEIFVPNASGTYAWFVDGTLLSASATYALTMQQIDDTDNLVLEDSMSGTIIPGQIVSGTFPVTVIPPEIACGDTLTASTTLSSDLVCSGTALAIGANNVTLDCQGHTITGDETGIGILAQNQDGITIKNCTVTNFADSIRLDSTHNSSLENNTADNNTTYGIRLIASTNNTLTGNKVLHNGPLTGPSGGFLVQVSSNANLFTSNLAEQNNGDGFNIVSSDLNHLVNNTSTNNAGSGYRFSDSNDNAINANLAGSNVQRGFHFSSSTGNTISGNTSQNNLDDGFRLVDFLNNILTSNVIVNNPLGIRLFFDANNNTIYDNKFDNPQNVSDAGTNTWNTTLQPGPNILGGPFIGGNFWSDYTGFDLDADEIGDTDLPYNASGSIANGGDFLPLRPPFPVASCDDDPNVPGLWKLTGDLNISSTSCLAISSDNVMLDCQGNTITGTDLIGTGVKVSGTNNVTVKNCTVQNFTSAIGISGTSGCSNLTVQNNTLQNNGDFGVDAVCLTTNNMTIASNTFSNNGLNTSNSGGGIKMTGTGHTIIGNTFINNDIFGIISSAHNTLISGNTFTGNLPASNTFPWTGIYKVNVNSSTIENNTIQNHDRGIKLASSTGILINNNTLSGNTLGIFVDPSNSNTLTGNTVQNSDIGVKIEESTDNVVKDNKIINNNTGINLLNSLSNFIYNNLFQNFGVNAIDNATNTWNTTLQSGKNILGHSLIGGNFWHDYAGEDPNGDGIGDTNLPYNSNNEIQNGGDFLPLVKDTDKPIVTLIAPEDNSEVIKDNFVFEYTVTDPTSGIVSCSLFFDLVLMATDISVVEEVSQTFDGQGEGEIRWMVGCTDNSPSALYGLSETRSLIIKSKQSKPAGGDVDCSDCVKRKIKE